LLSLEVALFSLEKVSPVEFNLEYLSSSKVLGNSDPIYFPGGNILAPRFPNTLNLTSRESAGTSFKPPANPKRACLMSFGLPKAKEMTIAEL